MIKKEVVLRYVPYGIWIFFTLFSFHYAVEVFNGGHSWKTGDWLINYSDGFVRRGLIGSILFKISEFGPSLLWVTFVVQITLYAIIFALVLAIYNFRKRSQFWLIILFSPSFLLFSFHDLGGGFRKEIIVLAIFSYFCLIYVRQEINREKLFFIILGYSFSILSHELTVFTLPFFLYLFYICAVERLIEPKSAITYAFIMVVISVLCLFFTSIYKGNEQSTQVICQSLITRGLDSSICNGAIHWLSEDSHYAINSVVNRLSYKSFAAPILLIISLMPLFFTTWWRKETYILLVLSAVFITPLFLVGLDWGRWIYILSFMSFCLALSEKSIVRVGSRKIFIYLSVAYVTLWSMPHCCAGGIKIGLIGSVPKYVVKTIKIINFEEVK